MRFSLSLSFVAESTIVPPSPSNSHSPVSSINRPNPCFTIKIVIYGPHHKRGVLGWQPWGLW